MRRGRWRDLLMVALAVAGGATRAVAAEPDLAAPSVCAPPCPEGESCVGNRCQRPTDQSPATSPRLPAPQAQPPPPPGSAPTSGPQPSAAPDARLPSPADDSRRPPGPAPPAPYQPPRLQHDGSPWTPSTYAPTNRRVKRRFRALPFLGIHSYQHQEASGYAPGLRLGTLLGGRISDFVSLNGELTLDVSNPRADEAAFQEWAFRVAFSPMIELPAGPVALIFGAKLGVFLLRTEQINVDLIVSSELMGFSAGFDGGVFVPVSAHTSIGVLLSFDWAGANQGCLGAPAEGSSCGSPAAHGAKLLGLSGGVLF